MAIIGNGRCTRALSGCPQLCRERTTSGRPTGFWTRLAAPLHRLLPSCLGRGGPPFLGGLQRHHPGLGRPLLVGSSGALSMPRMALWLAGGDCRLFCPLPVCVPQFPLAAPPRISLRSNSVSERDGSHPGDNLWPDCLLCAFHRSGPRILYGAASPARVFVFVLESSPDPTSSGWSQI